MEKIYFSKNINKIIEKLDFSKLGDRVAIKLHFGEKGCTTYINPSIVKTVYEKIVSLGKKATLVECNVLYRGSRTKAEEHIKLAKEHGFTFAPIDILDGENGQEHIEVGLEKGIVRKVKLGAGIKDYDSMIVLSHFKGHGMAGFGGALKNMGMGLGSRAGKLQMHSDIKPRIEKEKCKGCKTCIENCNANAISLIRGKAKINNEKCEGCAMCIAVCPNDAVEVPWHGTSAEKLQKKITDYVDGVFKIISKDKMIFVNVLENITENCDCMDKEQKPLMKDIGILTGNDIVAIDKASVDLVNKQIKYSNKKFSKLILSGITQINYACEKKLGKKDYEIVELD